MRATGKWPTVYVKPLVNADSTPAVHRGRGGLAAQEGALQHHAHHAIPGPLACATEGVTVRDARIVDENVETAQAAHGVGNHAPRVGRPAHVYFERDSSAVESP